MAKKEATRKPTGVDMTRLKQSEAAWLIGKPAVWLRDNSHLDGRNPDGSYDGRQLVQAVLSNFEPVRLDEDETEVVLKVVDSLMVELPSGRLDAMRRIASRHGAAGLAAIGKSLLDDLERFAYQPRQTTAAEIRAEAETKIADLHRENMIANGNFVARCHECDKYRWGLQWKTKPKHDDLPEQDTVCPSCFNRH